MDVITVLPDSPANAEVEHDAIEDGYDCAHAISTRAGLDGENCGHTFVDDRVVARQSRAMKTDVC